MNIGVFDSGLGGLTVLSAISKTYKGANIFYIADTKFAPYGELSKDEILEHSLKIAKYLIDTHKIEVLIVACNTATSAAIKALRLKYPSLLLIGTEPGLKPAINNTLSNSIGILATPATLKGEKYQDLLSELSCDKEFKVYEQACFGLVEEIEKGDLNSHKINEMLLSWLTPMRDNKVDTIVLGCTHYPLISNVIKSIMGEEINIIETGSAIAKRLKSLSKEKAHLNEGLLKIFIYSTYKINLDVVDMIINNYEYCGTIDIRR